MADTARKLVLNLAPVAFADKKVDVEFFEYQGEDQLRSLRNGHRGTHFVQRYRGTRIIVVPTVTNALPLGGTAAEFRLHSDLGFCAALLRNALLSRLHGMGRCILWSDPVEFVSQGTADDLLSAALPSPLTRPAWLEVRPKYEISVRRVEFAKQPEFVGLALNVRSHRLIRCPCSDLLAAGVRLVGQYVGRMEPDRDPRVAPKLRLAGRVRAVDGSRLLLEDAREGVEATDAADAYLQVHGGFAACLAAVFGARAGAVEVSLEQRLAAFRAGPARLERLHSALRGLNLLGLELLPGVPVKVGRFRSEEHDDDQSVKFPAVAAAPKPVFIFHPNNQQTNHWSDGGLQKFGPLDADVFTPKAPRVCVICQRDKQGQIEAFLNKLRDGIPAAGGGRAAFAQGFVRKYRLQDMKFDFYLADNATPAAYARAVREALAAQDLKGQGQWRWHLALVQIEEGFHSLAGDANPYLVTKASFLAADIPVQEFEIETASLRDGQLQYALNNMALAVYAKLGGVPWRVQANRALAHELVFGLGSAVISDGVLGNKDRMVGITTVFSGDGCYWLSNLSRSVPFDEYRDSVLASLRATVAQVRADMNWQKGDSIRLVFHSFKPFKDTEAEAVKEVMTELGEFDVQYAFLHVIEDHPYLLFDRGQKGVGRAGQPAKGTSAPQRGLYFQLSPRELLMTLTGPNDVKRPEDGLPFPVLLRLHRESTFDDVVYLAQQLYVFANLSWRSFFPSSMPVTILYSQLIAGLLGQLHRVTRWNPDIVLGRIGRTRWFL
jgi:hypothetical protein